MTIEYFIPVNGEYVNLNTFPETEQKSILEDYGRRYKEAIERILSARETESAENTNEEIETIEKLKEKNIWQ